MTSILWAVSFDIFIPNSTLLGNIARQSHVIKSVTELVDYWCSLTGVGLTFYIPWEHDLEC